MSLSDECGMSGFTSQTHTPEHTKTHGSLHRAARHQRQETKESETALNSMWTCLSLSMVQMVVFTAEASRPTGACIISAIRLNLILLNKRLCCRTAKEDKPTRSSQIKCTSYQ